MHRIIIGIVTYISSDLYIGIGPPDLSDYLGYNML